MRPSASLPQSQSTKTSNNVFGFGLKVSKEPILPRISSNQLLKYKKTQQSVSIMSKRIMKTEPISLSPPITQHVSLDHSPNRLVLILKNHKSQKGRMSVRRKISIDQKQIEQYQNMIQKYQQIMFKNIQRQASNICLQFPNKIHKLDKLSRIHRFPKRNIADKHYEQVRRHNMLVQKNLQHLKSKPLDIQSKKYEQKIIQAQKSIIIKTPKKRKDKIILQKIPIQKIDKSKINFNSLITNPKKSEVINGYQDNRDHEDSQLFQYIERQKSQNNFKASKQIKSAIYTKKCTTEMD